MQIKDILDRFSWSIDSEERRDLEFKFMQEIVKEITLLRLDVDELRELLKEEIKNVR